MLSSHSGILGEAISIASTSLQQRQSISVASFLQCPHSRSSRPKLFCKKVFLNISQNSQVSSLAKVFFINFAKFQKTPFFTEYLYWLLLAFSPIEISCSNIACYKLAAEA